MADPETFSYYALALIAKPHLIHTAIWAFLTSSVISGAEGKRWRTLATIACVGNGLVEFYYHWTYDPSTVLKTNGPVAKPTDTRWFYWEWYIYRYLGFAVVDALLAALLWVTSTNRLLVRPPSPAQQIADANQLLVSALTAFNMVGPTRNAIRQDPQLRSQSEAYWTEQIRTVEELEQDRRVVSARNLTLSRQDPAKNELRASNWVDNVFNGLKLQAAVNAQAQATAQAGGGPGVGTQRPPMPPSNT